MILQNFFILLSILTVFAWGVPHERTFEVDSINKTFLKNGRPFRFVSGQFDYFRSHPESWQRKLRTMRAAGINTVTTLIEWSLHNPKENVYKWDGIADIERFIKLAAIEDLYVILRAGPYISGERDLGGFPFWLLKKYPGIQLRTSDKNFINENRIWFTELMKRIEPHLYGNDGPVILIQLENNYMAFSNCDALYFKWLYNETISYVKDKAVLFSHYGAECGFRNGILTTNSNENGPYINNEYFLGWYTNWRESTASTKLVPKYLIDLLNKGANVNFFMFYGGTNFGFTAGARTDIGGEYYKPSTTSYDYDAAMDEAGDPTEKYFKLRNIIGEYLPLPNITIPISVLKKNYGVVQLTPQFSILSQQGRQIADGTVNHIKPLSFEMLNQKDGLILYETKLPTLKEDPLILMVNKIHDRGYFYIDNHFIGILSRSQSNKKIEIVGDVGSILQIVVESQGRAVYENVPLDYKGILSDVFYDGQILNNWTMTKYSFENYDKILSIINKKQKLNEVKISEEQKISEDISEKINRIEYENDCNVNEINGLVKNSFYSKTLKKLNTDDEHSQLMKEKLLRNGPVIFYGELHIAENDIGDTYLDTTGWGKGFVIINNFNLGRYWPAVGPQITLFVPREILKEGVNEIILVEYQKVSLPKITFQNTPNLGYK